MAPQRTTAPVLLGKPCIESVDVNHKPAVSEMTSGNFRPAGAAAFLARSVRFRMGCLALRLPVVVNDLAKLQRIDAAERTVKSSNGAQAKRPQTSTGDTATDADPGGGQPALVARPFDKLRTGYVADALARGRRFPLLNVIDDYSPEGLACIVDTSLSGRRVVRELTAIAERRGLRCMVVSDNPVLREVEGGTELTSHAVHAGARTPGWSGITSRRESRGRMASWSRSMVASATSA